MQRWWILAVIVILGAVLLQYNSLDTFPSNFVTGYDHNSFIRVEVSPDGASPGQVACVDLPTTILENCHDPSCNDIVVVDASGTVVPFAVLPSGDFQYTVPITITNQNTEDLVEYQVQLSVDTATLISQDKLRQDCADIRFTKDSNTFLPYWVEPNTCNTSATKIWVKIPTLPADGATNISMHYGSSTAQSQSSTLSVFVDEIDNAKGVWLLEEGAGNVVYDASGNGYNGIIYGAVWVEGQYGQALIFDGADDYLKFSNVGNLTEYTLIVMGKYTQDPTTIGGSWWNFVARGMSSVGTAIETGHYAGSEYHLLKVRYSDNSSKAISVGDADTERHLWVYRVKEKDSIRIDVWDKGISNYDSLDATKNIKGLQDLYIAGFNSQGSSPLLVDYILLFDRYLSDAEIQNIYDHYFYATANYPQKLLIRKYAPSDLVVTLGEESQNVPQICFNPNYDNTWTTKPFYILLDSNNDYSQHRTTFAQNNIGNFVATIGPLTPIMLYNGSVQVSISPDDHNSGDKNIIITASTGFSEGISRLLCSIEITSPTFVPETYEYDVNSDTVIFTYNFAEDGDYNIGANCVSFFTEQMTSAYSISIDVSQEGGGSSTGSGTGPDTEQDSNSQNNSINSSGGGENNGSVGPSQVIHTNKIYITPAPSEDTNRIVHIQIQSLVAIGDNVSAGIIAGIVFAVLLILYLAKAHHSRNK